MAKLVGRLEAVFGACKTTLLQLAVHLLDGSQVLFPFRVGQFECASFAWIPHDDLGIVIPVDTQQALQVAIICILSRLIQQGLDPVVLDVFPPGNDGEDVE